MILAGDEIGHTQHGNNNTYCQDNDISWLNWNLTDEQRAFLHFIQIGHQYSAYSACVSAEKIFSGTHHRRCRCAGHFLVSTLGRRNVRRSLECGGYTQCLGVRFPGDFIGDVTERGEPIIGDSVVLLVNAHHEAMAFTLPSHNKSQEWERLIDTTDPEAACIKLKGGEQYGVKGRSMVVLRSTPV